MAFHVFTEINGQRVDTTDLPRVSEYSCDVCGEFLAVEQLATLSLQIRTPRGQAEPRHFETHPSCMPKLLDAIASAIVESSVQS